MLNLNLDKRNDILYLGISDTRNSYGDEICNGLVILHDLQSDAITGITIFDFSKRCQDGSLYGLPIPITIDFKKDVLPKLLLKN